MARPATREQFKQKCLRKLGSPVVDVNVDDEQLEDLIDDALDWFFDYHFDGSHHVFLKHEIIKEDKDNGYITLPQSFIGVRRILPFQAGQSTSNLFNIEYQFHLNNFDIFNSPHVSIIPYWQAKQHIAHLEELFVGEQPIRYNRHRNILHVDMNWTEVNEGVFIVVEGYKKTDPEEYPDVWADRWLNRYVTALFKRQWGLNMKKFGGIQLPGGVELNGKEIYDEAVEEIGTLEEEMIQSYSIPVTDHIG